MIVLATLLLQSAAPVLENDFVRVSRDAASCARANTALCGDRVIVALTDVEVRVGPSAKQLHRGDVAVVRANESYAPPASGSFFEVVIKPNHPRATATREIIPPAKNTIRFDRPRYVVFEEHLAVGDTRPRHSHSERVVIQLNQTRLEQKPDDGPMVVREIEPDRAAFNSPVIHTAKNVGERPLRGIVIEFKPAR